MRRAWIILGIALLLTACGESGLPQVTPTVAPTRTATLMTTDVAQVPTRTPFPTATDTEAPPATIPPTLSETPAPTLTPSETLTETPTSTPTLTETFTLTPTPTATFTATRTDAPSPTPTFTPSETYTPTLTFTPTPTLTPSMTPTFTPSLTPTETPEPSVTPLPVLAPSDTPTLTPTATETPTPFPTPTFSLTPSETVIPPSPTPQPSATPNLTQTNEAALSPTPPTPTPDITLTVNALFSLTPLATATLTPQPTFTAFPTASATNTIGAPPTLDVTPTFATAEAETPVSVDVTFTLTPIIGDATIEIFLPTQTATPAPTVAEVPIMPTVGLNQLSGGGPSVNLESRAFALGPGGGVSFQVGGSISNPTLFVRNPMDPNRFIVTDTLGLLYELNGGVSNRPTTSPFMEFVPASREANNSGLVVDAAWSPDGTRVAFTVDANGQTANDGVWWYAPGQTVPVQLLRNCRPHQNCPEFVDRSDVPFFYWTVSIVWASTNDAVLATVVIGDDGWDNRQGIVILPPTGDETFSRRRAPVYKYDYGDWARDGNRIVVSGRRPDGRVILGYINRPTDFANYQDLGEEVILDGSASGLWLQDGVQIPGDPPQLVALGRYGDANGPMRIFDQYGNPLTSDIGFARPVAVKWDPERTQVYVQTEDGRRYVAGINGSVVDITAQVGDTQAINWVSGRLPPPADLTSVEIPADYIPSGVIEGGRYTPGQQLRVVTEVDLRVRSAPNQEANELGAAPIGSYVAILAGPVNNGCCEWWQIKTAAGLVGWSAAMINGVPSLAP